MRDGLFLVTRKEAIGAAQRKKKAAEKKKREAAQKANIIAKLKAQLKKENEQSDTAPPKKRTKLSGYAIFYQKNVTQAKLDLAERSRTGKLKTGQLSKYIGEMWQNWKKKYPMRGNGKFVSAHTLSSKCTNCLSKLCVQVDRRVVLLSSDVLLTTPCALCALRTPSALCTLCALSAHQYYPNVQIVRMTRDVIIKLVLVL